MVKMFFPFPPFFSFEMDFYIRKRDKRSTELIKKRLRFIESLVPLAPQKRKSIKKNVYIYIYSFL